MLPKQKRIVVLETNDARYLHAGCVPIQTMPAAEWRLACPSLIRQGYRIVLQYRAPLRRLCTGHYRFDIIAGRWARDRQLQRMSDAVDNGTFRGEPIYAK